MPFPKEVKEEILVKTRRCCCLCRKYKGRNIEVHHIDPESEGGSNDIDNAIALCFDCHADSGHYNSNHPKGNKFTKSELIKHRNNWIDWCKNNSNTNLPGFEIKINPKKIILVKNGGFISKSASVKITNTSNDVLYDICFGILIKSNISFDSSVHLKIKNPQGEKVIWIDEKQFLDQGNMELHDKNNNIFSVRWIDSIDPFETRTYDVVIENKKFVPDKKLSVICEPIVFGYNEDQEEGLMEGGSNYGPQYHSSFQFYFAGSSLRLILRHGNI